MPRSNRHIQDYEKEILELRSQGLTLKEIGGKYGFTFKQSHNFFTRYNKKQQMLASGIALKRKGRPPKDYVVSEHEKVTELKYILARKDAKIKVRLRLRREKKRSQQSCSSTVTKAFNIHRQHILS